MGRHLGDGIPASAVGRLRTARQVVAVVATAGEGGPDAAPVSLVAVASPRRLLLGLARDRTTLANIRAGSRVAASLCLEPDLAITVAGTARVVAESLPTAAHVAAVEVAVETVKDDLHPAARILSRLRLRWESDAARQTDAALLADLRRLAGRRQDAVATR
jgi:Pyridoxamine 5'-phosphate oxidase